MSDETQSKPGGLPPKLDLRSKMGATPLKPALSVKPFQGKPSPLPSLSPEEPVVEAQAMRKETMHIKLTDESIAPSAAGPDATGSEASAAPAPKLTPVSPTPASATKPTLSPRLKPPTSAKPKAVKPVTPATPSESTPPAAAPERPAGVKKVATKRPTGVKKVAAAKPVGVKRVATKRPAGVKKVVAAKPVGVKKVAAKRMAAAKPVAPAPKPMPEPVPAAVAPPAPIAVPRPKPAPAAAPIAVPSPPPAPAAAPAVPPTPVAAPEVKAPSEAPTLAAATPAKPKPLIPRTVKLKATPLTSKAAAPAASGQFGAAVSEAKKKETSKVPLDPTAAAPEAPVGPKTIRVKPVGLNGAVKPGVPSAPSTPDEPNPKRQTSRIPLEHALGDAKNTGPKTIRLKRPSDAPGKVAPSTFTAKDSASVPSKTTQLDEAPLGDVAAPTPTQKRTIKVKRPQGRPGGGVAVKRKTTTAGAARTSAAAGAMGGAPIAVSVKDGAHWTFITGSILTLIVLICTLYLFASQAVGPNHGLTQLSSLIDGPDLSVPGNWKQTRGM
jgi:hypothetical protein